MLTTNTLAMTIPVRLGEVFKYNFNYCKVVKFGKKLTGFWYTVNGDTAVNSYMSFDYYNRVLGKHRPKEAIFSRVSEQKYLIETPERSVNVRVDMNTIHLLAELYGKLGYKVSVNI